MKHPLILTIFIFFLAFSMQHIFGTVIGDISKYGNYLQTTITQTAIQQKQTHAEKPDSIVKGDSLQHQITDPAPTDSIQATVEQTKSRIDDTIFPLGIISFADSVVMYDPGAFGEGTGDEPEPKYQNQLLVLGPPDYDAEIDTGYVALGTNGTIVLKFTDNVLIDGPGPDLYVYEIGDEFEECLVWISQNGKIFLPVGRTSRTNPGIDIHPYAKPGVSYSYIKLRDNSERGDSDDPALGADIDAVGAINTAIRIIIQADRLFAFKTSNLTQEAPEILSEIAQQIRSIPHAIVSIETHTDTRGSEDFNLIISQSQAATIRNYFLDTEQLISVEYSVLGWGETHPIASDDTQTGRQKNRRLVIMIRSE
jgi:outer membrane protein OmpA-like peptidoglycan-associated protein